MVFGQIALKLGMFWTAAHMEAMCYRGILEITFWTAGSGIADAGVALLGCSLPTCFPSPPAPWGVLCKSGPPTFKTTSSTFFLTSCNCSVTLKCQDLQNSPRFSVLSALFHMRAVFCLESLSGLSSQGKTLWENVCTVPFQITLFNHLY